jgi:hypothetical protein
MARLFPAIILFFWGLGGCAMIASSTQSISLDVKLVGVWSGEYLEEGGTLKSWVQTRNADGTYSIDFSFKEPNGTIQRFTETGRWWIMDRLFHELSSSDMTHPDKYRYAFDEKRCVRFELIESDGYAEETDRYVFNECLTADSPPAVFGESI